MGTVLVYNNLTDRELDHQVIPHEHFHQHSTTDIEGDFLRILPSADRTAASGTWVDWNKFDWASGVTLLGQTSWYDDTNDVFKAPTDGLYLMCALVQMNYNASGYRAVGLRRTGSTTEYMTLWYGNAPVTSAVTTVHNPVAMRYLRAGDAIEVHYAQSCGSSLTMQSAYNWFYVIRLCTHDRFIHIAEALGARDVLSPIATGARKVTQSIGVGETVKVIVP